MLRDLLFLNAKLDQALTQFAKPGDLPEYSTADYQRTAKRRDVFRQRTPADKLRDYATHRDVAWDLVGNNQTPARKGLAKEAGNAIKATRNKPAVWSSKDVGPILKKYHSKRLAFPLKKLP